MKKNVNSPGKLQKSQKNISGNNNQNLAGTKYKSFKHQRLPPLSNSRSMSAIKSNDFYKTKNIFGYNNNHNYQNENLDNLKQQLSTNRFELHKKKTEILELKIKYSKLNEENKYNKQLIANILGIELNKVISREALIDKIENSKLTEWQEKNLKEAYETIKLKLEIGQKKKLLIEQEQQIENYKKNAKTKNLTELENTLLQKSEDHRQILRNLKKLETYLENGQKKIPDLEEKIENTKKSQNSLIEKENDSKNKLEETKENKNNIQKQIKTAEDKLRKQEKTLREKQKTQLEDEKKIQEKNMRLEEINDYKNRREEIEKTLKEKTQKKNETDKYISQQEQQISELNKTFNELSEKNTNNNNEKEKLISKSREPKREQDRMKSLEEKLAKIKKENEDYKKEHEEIQKKIRR